MEPISQMPNEESTYLEWNGQLYIDFFYRKKEAIHWFLVGWINSPLIYTCVFAKDDIVMNQFILLPKPYKIVSSETMMDRLISVTKCSTDEVP